MQIDPECLQINLGNQQIDLECLQINLENQQIDLECLQINLENQQIDSENCKEPPQTNRNPDSKPKAKEQPSKK
ncbi:hypothetical protein PBF_05393 [Cytobacillus firmus DS1]|uniref:Uncharacterized protein n=1 Tax=Cytobacillus firmus DS1 TaxID=1307436 RepID=W7LAH1_CYTFI|nr:hypothetical protein PBF_05393 [Cytobacillus firmus DS1]